MVVFVTGVAGQLGSDAVREIISRGYDCIGSDVLDACGLPCPYVTMDITEKNEVDAVIVRTHPDVVVHCAAWTAVDDAEDPRNRDRVFAINEIGTRNIAEACRKINCKMIYISTDYVFSGQGTDPWRADCRDFAPLNIYGQSKLAGEEAVAETLQKYFIVRTAWVFGQHGRNFIKTMIRAGKTYDTVRVVKDQIGTPTFTCDLARLLIDMAETEEYGYYHATNEGGYISWYEFCCEFYRQYGLKTQVIPVTTAEYGQNRAVRPQNSRLDRSKLHEAGFTPLPPWQDAVRRYLKTADL